MDEKVKNPSRRRFVRNTGATAVAGAIGVAAAGAGTAASAHDRDRDDRHKKGPKHKHGHGHRHRGRGRRPNILILLCDEMRYPPVYESETLKQFRQNFLLTQDALRANGVEFHRHYAAATACSPSRASIFTGQYPSLHGVTNTTGAAKEANDPDVYWLDPNSVPTLGDYFRAGGYRTFYKGKWHASDADLQIPGTHDQVLSYDSTTGAPDPEKQQLYLDADRLDGYGFTGWVGPEPHGKAPLNTGSSPATGVGRDVGFASQAVGLIQQLDADPDDTPWFMVSSFVNPHDITLFGYFAQTSGSFNFTIGPDVPPADDLFTDQFLDSLADGLENKPSCQKSYRDSYNIWMQPVFDIPPSKNTPEAKQYFQLYYQLQQNVDGDMFQVYTALQQSRFFENTIVVFTSDHGDLLGSHGYMHQKWYQTYDEALRVPLIFSNPRLFRSPAEVHSVTSHIDMLPTLLGLCGLDVNELNPDVATGHSDPLVPVGRDLHRLVLGKEAAVHDPIYFMTDDDPSRGLDQDNWLGIAYDSVKQPNHIETVIVEMEGKVWKYSQYFDNPQFWSNPGTPGTSGTEDIVKKIDDAALLASNPPADTYEYPDVKASDRIKYDPEDVEFEMYNVSDDPMELDNLAGQSAYAAIQQILADLLIEQRKKKRLIPISGTIPGQPYPDQI